MHAFTSAHCVVSALGFTTAENLKRMQSGETGIRRQRLPFSDVPFFAAMLDVEKLDEAFARLGDPASFTRIEKASLLAMHTVLQESGIDPKSPELLLVFATTKGNIALWESGAVPAAGRNGNSTLAGLAGMLARKLGMVNRPVVVSNACISGSQALLVAIRLLKGKPFRYALVAGADMLSEFVLSGFRAFEALASGACRPFDALRDGLSLGEAAAAVLLVKEEATPGSWRLAAGACTNDAHHISRPSPEGEGLYHAIRLALAAETVRPDFISAHGTGTFYNDEMEARALTRAGLNEVPVNSLKGYVGHTLGAAGLVETLLTMEALNQGQLVASAGCSRPGVTDPIRIVLNHQPCRHPRAFLKTSSAFGGSNAALLFRKS
jgi:3-oxoacyl-[acyl-carrier-protein] synthase-1